MDMIDHGSCDSNAVDVDAGPVSSKKDGGSARHRRILDMFNPVVRKHRASTTGTANGNWLH